MTCDICWSLWNICIKPSVCFFGGNSKKDNVWGSTRIGVKWLTSLCPAGAIKVFESLLLGTSLVLYITNFLKPVFTPRTFEHIWIPSSFEPSMHFDHLCLSFCCILKLLNWKAPLFAPRFFVLHVFTISALQSSSCHIESVSTPSLSLQVHIAPPFCKVFCVITGWWKGQVGFC